MKKILALFVLLVLFSCSGGGGGDTAEPQKEAVTPAPTVTTDDDSIYVDVQPELITFYIKTSSGLYLRYLLRHDDLSYSQTILRSNYDSWRMYDVFLVEKTAEWTFSEVYKESVLNTGAWECAFREQGLSFVGGSMHGGETLESVSFYIDGVKKDFTTARYKCKSIKFSQQSKLYRSGTQTVIAKHFMEYNISNDGIRLYQDVEWLENVTLDCFYLAMLPIKRTLSDGTQITHTALINGQAYDVSTPEKVVSSGAKEPRKGITDVEIWGGNIKAVVNVLQRPDIDTENFVISDSPNYNKLYFDVCGEDYSTSTGEIMAMEVELKIDSLP